MMNYHIVALRHESHECVSLGVRLVNMTKHVLTLLESNKLK